MTMELADRLAGAVWGHLVGDAVGVPYEFKDASGIAGVHFGVPGTHGQPPGTWSDDGALMLALLDSLLRAAWATRRCSIPKIRAGASSRGRTMAPTRPMATAGSTSAMRPPARCAGSGAGHPPNRPAAPVSATSATAR